MSEMYQELILQDQAIIIDCSYFLDGYSISYVKDRILKFSDLSSISFILIKHLGFHHVIYFQSHSFICFFFSELGK